MKLITRRLYIGEIMSDRECVIETKDGTFGRTGQRQGVPEILWVLASTNPDDELRSPSGPGGRPVCTVVGYDKAGQSGLPPFFAPYQGSIHLYIRAGDNETGATLAAADEVLFIAA